MIIGLEMSIERFIGLDIGTKRIGVAISDALKITAQPLEVVLRIPENASIKKIGEICTQNNIKTIVAGFPKNMNGTIGPQAEDVKKYTELLKEKLSVNIIFEDERLTSKQAERILAEQNKKASKKNKGLIDIASAAIILQQYLDRRSF
ncbi:MAG: Holliday junction resolvase RuvX [Candidatus Gastranaerophilales bacterium]|nr:Holliday junction resolvase RuvX [Candidatus Gastranaerophilales bacterium]